ncbi:hypothetical protein MY11210_005030 [Beauveria gryllotalpidicola]
MSSHANASNNTSQGGGGSGGYPSTWPFNAAGFNAATVGTNTAHTSPTTSNSGSSGTGGIGRPLLSSGSGSMFPMSGSSSSGTGGSGRYAARTGNPYETSLVRRRNQMSSSATASSRDRRTQNGQSQGGDPERKRVVVACLRCRKRKIRCSGDDGNGGSCTNCKNANEPQLLTRAIYQEMRKKEHEKRMAAAAAVNTFSYDLDACRQYQSRGAASIGPNMSAAAPPHAHSTVYGASSGGAFGGPSNVMYNWAPGAAGGGYGDGSGHGAGAHGNAGASMGYGMPYHSMSYHGMPSPEASYLGENDLMDRPTTATMADAGAFALQSLSQGLTSGSGSGHGHPYGHGAMATSTPRSLPGPPTVLGSSRGVPPSSVFSASRAPQQYPSPATTPITSGVSPVWTGYEQSPYGTAAMPTSMAAQSLERLPDLYTATPPPPPPPPAENAASGRPGDGSQHGDDEGLNGGDGSSSNGNGHNQTQQQHNHFEYSYGDSGGQSEGNNGEEHSGGGGVDMVNNHTAAPGTY